MYGGGVSEYGDGGDEGDEDSEDSEEDEEEEESEEQSSLSSRRRRVSVCLCFCRGGRGTARACMFVRWLRGYLNAWWA